MTCESHDVCVHITLTTLYLLSISKLFYNLQTIKGPAMPLPQPHPLLTSLKSPRLSCDLSREPFLLRAGSGDTLRSAMVTEWVRSSREEMLPLRNIVVEGVAWGLYFFLLAFSAFRSLRNGVGNRTSWNGMETVESHLHVCMYCSIPWGGLLQGEGQERGQKPHPFLLTC